MIGWSKFLKSGETPMLDAMSRRSFVKTLAISGLASSAAVRSLGEDRVATSGSPTEWSYQSGKQYSDPFNEVEVDAIITLPSGQEERVPGFWAGGSTCRVRYAPPLPGNYLIRSACNDKDNHDLHDQKMTLQVAPYSGQNSHYKHGVL
jgi:hypothetical protein